LEEQRRLSGLSERAWDWSNEFKEAAAKARKDLPQVEKQANDLHARVMDVLYNLVMNDFVQKEKIEPALKLLDGAKKDFQKASEDFRKALDMVGDQMFKR
jgi:hypothetical protein